MSPKVVLTCARSFRKGALRNAFWPAPPSAARAGGIRNQVIQREYTMHKKALTVAIAGALAAPMAAQAVDFTISGHVNRALVIVDSDDSDSSKAEVLNNGSSSTRVRWTGSSEMMDGNSVGIMVEYEETADGSLGLRLANVNYAGEFGKLTIGQDSEAGDGSAYMGNVRTFGIGHGQEKGSAFTLGDYFGSLDAGSRKNVIRYDTPALGPVSAAVSVGNDDRISLSASLSTEFSGSSFNAMVASLREDSEVEGKAQETIGASFGVSMASGLGISGAWARGDNNGSTAATPNDDVCGTLTGTVAISVAAVPATGPAANTCYVQADTPAMMGTDPSLFQAAIAYTFGDTTVAASWYSSEDFANEGSEGTAIGIGVNHNLPKVRAQVYAAVQGYDAEDMAAGIDTDETVLVVGTRVMF